MHWMYLYRLADRHLGRLHWFYHPEARNEIACGTREHSQLAAARRPRQLDLYVWPAPGPPPPRRASEAATRMSCRKDADGRRAFAGVAVWPRARPWEARRCSILNVLRSGHGSISDVPFGWVVQHGSTATGQDLDGLARTLGDGDLR